MLKCLNVRIEKIINRLAIQTYNQAKGDRTAPNNRLANQRFAAHIKKAEHPHCRYMACRNGAQEENLRLLWVFGYPHP
jgi:hypothetical protein